MPELHFGRETLERTSEPARGFRRPLATKVVNSNLQDLNGFQHSLVERLRKIYGEGIETRLEESGVGRYVSVRLPSHPRLKLFIYDDEAGVSYPEKGWIICETPDYDDGEQLAEAFLEKLRMLIDETEKLDSGPQL